MGLQVMDFVGIFVTCFVELVAGEAPKFACRFVLNIVYFATSHCSVLSVMVSCLLLYIIIVVLRCCTALGAQRPPNLLLPPS